MAPPVEVVAEGAALVAEWVAVEPEAEAPPEDAPPVAVGAGIETEEMGLCSKSISYTVKQR